MAVCVAIIQLWPATLCVCNSYSCRTQPVNSSQESIKIHSNSSLTKLSYLRTLVVVKILLVTRKRQAIEDESETQCKPVDYFRMMLVSTLCLLFHDIVNTACLVVPFAVSVVGVRRGACSSRCTPFRRQRA